MTGVRLGDHAKLIRGITFKPVDKCDPRDDGAVVCMRTKNVQTTLDASDLIAVPNSLVKNPEKLLLTGDILVSSANSWNLVGKCCQVPKIQYPSTAGGFISILRPKTEQLASGYLYRWFSSDVIQKKLRSFANQTTNISNLDHKRTLELQIPLPPLAEQKRIAGILDAADALRAKRREALAQLDTLLQSTFLDMFGDPLTNPMGWEVRRLADVAEFHAGSSLPAGEEFIGQDGGYLNLKVSDLNKPENTTRIVSSKLWSTDRGKGVMAPERATVFPKRGGAIGTNKKRLLDRAAVLDPNLMAVSAAERLHHLFLYRWFFTFDLVDITSGSTVPQLNKRDLSPLPIQIPPTHLQRRFAAIVESVEKQESCQRAHLAELDNLFASLQSRAFRGDL